MKFSGPIGVCGRCERWCELAKLRKQVIAGSISGLKVCPSCLDQDHPQQFVNRVLARADIQAVKEPRPDPYHQQWLVGNPVPAGEMFLSTGKVWAV